MFVTEEYYLHSYTGLNSKAKLASSYLEIDYHVAVPSFELVCVCVCVCVCMGGGGFGQFLIIKNIPC